MPTDRLWLGIYRDDDAGGGRRVAYLEGGSMIGLTTERTEGTERATPETDAELKKLKNAGMDQAGKWIQTNFARKLERERDEARNRMADALQEMDLRTLDFERMKQERDEAIKQCKALWSLVEVEKKKTYNSRQERDEAIADRDIARLKALESDRAHDRMVGELEGVYKKLDEARDNLARMASAAQAVVDRWDLPAWKDAEPTAAVIYRLRDSLQEARP